MRTRNKAIIAGVATATAMTLGLPGVAEARSADDGVRIVQQGDTLSRIAPENTGHVCVVNVAEGRIIDCDTLNPGNIVRVNITENEIARVDRLVENWRNRPQPRSAPVTVETEPVAEVSQASSTPAPEPQPEPEPAPAPAAPSGGVWDQLAQCESSGNWSTNTGNGYYGGLQFSEESWRAAGGSGMPHEASRDEQIRVAQNLQRMQGWGAWPACSERLGLR